MYSLKLFNKAKILLFEDSDRSKIFERFILKDFNYSKLNSNFLSTKLIWLSFSSLFFSIFYMLKYFDKNFSLKKNLYFAYVFGVIKSYNPKVVLSFYNLCNPYIYVPYVRYM